MNSAMMEATRLTREGKLTEATALIQRTLRGGQAGPQTSAYRTNWRGPAALPGPVVVEPEDAGAAPSAEPPASEAPASAPSSAKAGRPIRTTARRMPSGGRSAFGSMPTIDLRMPGLEGLRRGRMPRRAPVDVQGPGQWIAGAYTSAAGTREYRLYIPSGYHGQALPLVVMLHGCTQSPDDFAAGTGMNRVAEAEGFLVAYPAQEQTANISKCWNWFEAAHQQREEGEPSLIAGITRQVMAQYKSDPGRIYVAGLSAGGAMAAIMGATHPDLYAAVGVHSGLAAGSARDLPSAFGAMQRGGRGERTRGGRVPPLIVFQGDGDSTVHPCNADHLVEQWIAAGGSRRAGETVAPATLEQGQVPGGHSYLREIHRDGRGRSVVERWTIHDAGHAWSGGSLDGSFTDPAGPDASREFARFFREHARMQSGTEGA